MYPRASREGYISMRYLIPSFPTTKSGFPEEECRKLVVLQIVLRMSSGQSPEMVLHKPSLRRWVFRLMSQALSASELRLQLRMMTNTT